MRSKRTAVAMLAAAGAMLVATATGVAVAQQERTLIFCEHQSPGKRGGECKGTETGNTFYSTEFNDRIAALGSSDLVNAYAGDDRVELGSGDDFVYGGRGDDTLYGGEGKDSFYDQDPYDPKGNPGSLKPADTDRVYGGADDDWINVHDGGTDDVVSCGEGRDTVWYDKIGKGSDKLVGCEVRHRGDPF
jgi:RTX calcium-binding nonapeptide repeat (4 copies)